MPECVQLTNGPNKRECYITLGLKVCIDKTLLLIGLICNLRRK